jgi:hypothetical protein
VKQLDPGHRRDEKQVVGERIEPCARGGFLAQSAGYEAVENVGGTCSQQSQPDEAAVPVKSGNPDDGYEQQAHA